MQTRVLVQATGCAVITLLAGCVAEPAIRYDPAMPRVVLPAPPPTASKEEVMARARERLLRSEFAGALDALKALPESERAPALKELSAIAAAESPVRAVNLATAMPVGLPQQDAVAAAVREWHLRDPESALAWALAVKDTTLRFAALDAIAAELVDRNPSLAMEQILARPESPGRAEFLRLAAAQWARRDAASALSWAEKLSGQPRLDVLSSIGFEMAQTDPQRAAEIASALPESRDRWLLFMEIAATWTARNSDAAASWMRSLPAGSARQAALAGIDSATGTYSRGSRAVQGTYRGPSRMGGGSPVVVAAAGDSRALPTGREREEALQREFERRLQTSPALAANWLATLPQPDVSDQILRTLAQEWYRYDPAAADQWLRLHVTSDARREQILREIIP